MCDDLERPLSDTEREFNLFISTVIKCSPKDCAGRVREDNKVSVAFTMPRACMETGLLFGWHTKLL